ncbi:MAG: prepilin-type N-terminal cleavage/methylation domain-containing protein [Candidatus Omnitrophica bacterium]|nr:prepilin-type N-terminal cleavage/methylation domain-containing protein [Candidatus Omnitrophota bacterium]
MDRDCNPALQFSLRSFTLLELIVVIVILGILATLGYTQYTKVVEKGRIAEVIPNFGKMRSLAVAYYMQNGTLSPVTAADLGVGSDIPASCNSTHYFWYGIQAATDTSVCFWSGRCTAGGKAPDWTSATYWPEDWFSIGGGDNYRTYSEASGHWANGLVPPPF